MFYNSATDETVHCCKTRNTFLIRCVLPSSSDNRSNIYFRILPTADRKKNRQDGRFHNACPPKLCVGGEDISFCLRAKEKGFKIYIDPLIKVGHEKKIVF